MIIIKLWRGGDYLWQAVSKTVESIEDAKKFGVAMLNTAGKGVDLVVIDQSEDGKASIIWRYHTEKRGANRWTMNVRGC